MISPLQEHLRNLSATLPAELQRAAFWVLANPAEVGLWSMRRQAQAVGVAPATMLRMARAAGYTSYEAFRAPFQRALAGGSGLGLRDRAARLQASRDHAAPEGHDALTQVQTDAIASVCHVNDDAHFDAAVAALLAARQVGFLGLRSAFGIAHQMRYAYHLLRRNGILIEGLGGTPAEEADCLQAGDALVVISQAPYPAATLQLTQQIAQRGVTVLALTDSPTNPVALAARHVLHFTPPAETDPADLSGQRGPGSFFHSTAGLLGLAEHLIARLAAHGGDEVLQRLNDIETRLHAEGVYWTEAPRKRGRISSKN
ncbi:MurR/RpiR family transcriptional regulator [Achromobacter seleniivolatilans]|uniref:MurR/RpiR family transcriptional regulator n=1 Tax=Achromobacter seleniivolatilans TaxID=3047478 RepID=A0ABY9M838_9BURK|nr:MurR/RpiR family transcriptional regulator [Achromobacter sp. R39]WMD23161.1 MurR/RpiR family transcriptional regulator [Achromobacter sp. R39]